MCSVLRSFAATAAFASMVIGQDIKWWQGDLAGALESAKEAKAGAALLYLWHDDTNCKAMFGDTFGDPAVKVAVAGYVCMGAQKGTPGGDAVFARFAIQQVPTVLIVRPDGQIVDAVAGFRPVQPFLAELKRIEQGEGTVAALREAAQAAPDDLGKQLLLAKKLRAIGDRAGGGQVLDAIIEKDPKGKDEASAEAQLLKVLDTVFLAGVATKDVDLKPLEQFLVKQKCKRVLFLGYDRMAAVELARDDLKSAAAVAQKAWKNIPDDMVLEWGQIVAAKAYGYHEELSRPQLKLALQISTAALKAAEAVGKERGNPFLADAYYLQACVQMVNNLRKDAFASMEHAIELDPANENLKKALDRFKDGSK